jgi:hypothetical protein
MRVTLSQAHSGPHSLGERYVARTNSRRRMPAFRVPTVCFAAVAALVGCSRQSLLNMPPPEVRPKETPTTEVRPKETPARTQTEKRASHRTFACTQFPAGNDRTREFLAWARDQYAAYCTMELDADGNCVELNIHPCWPRLKRAKPDLKIDLPYRKAT